MIQVTVVDLDSGDTETMNVNDDDYLLLTVGDCNLHHTQMYPTTGTHLLTIKGCKRRVRS